MEEKVEAKLKTISPSPGSHFFFLYFAKYENKSGLFLHLQYKQEYDKREANQEYNVDILKPRFTNKTEAVCKPVNAVTEKNSSSCNSSNPDTVDNQPAMTGQKVPLLQRKNYVSVEECSEHWRGLRVGVIAASKAPALLGFCGAKEFDSAWLAIKNKIDESKLNPKRAKLPNFIRVECGYFRHPSDNRFGASPDGIVCGHQQYQLLEIKARSMPNEKQMEKMNEEEKKVKV
ncbi:hypothetical protein ACROYT_G041136 [Oculina patagonica]